MAAMMQEFSQGHSLLNYVPATKEIYWKLVVVRPSKSKTRNVRVECRFYLDCVRRVLKLDSGQYQSKMNRPRVSELLAYSTPYDVKAVIAETQSELDQLLGSDGTDVQAPKSAAMTVQPRKRPGRTMAQQYLSPANSNYLEGVITDLGIEPREVNGEILDHFYVDLSIDSQDGKVERIYGEALRSAINVANVGYDDRVRISCDALPTISDPQRTDMRLSKGAIPFSVERIF